VPNLYASGVSGTIWQGQAGNIVVDAGRQPIILGETEWHLRVLPLLMGKLGLEIDAQNGSQKIVADATVTLPNQVALKSAEVNLPSSLVQAYVDLPVSLEGRFGATFRSLQFDGEGFTELDGALTWHDAAVDAGMGRQQLGSYLAVLSLEGERAYSADISELQGNLGLNGTLKFEQNTRAYDALLTLQPNDSVDKQLLMMLQQVGKTTDDGRIEVKYKGKL
jgi:general secretion pathway protein N